MPRGPCVSGVVTRARASGVSRPIATSTSPRPASSRIARVFSATCRASTLPAVHVTATSSHSGDATAYSRARLSSMPVSQSTMIGILPAPSLTPEIVGQGGDLDRTSHRMGGSPQRRAGPSTRAHPGHDYLDRPGLRHLRRERYAGFVGSQGLERVELAGEQGGRHVMAAPPLYACRQRGPTRDKMHEPDRGG